MPSVKVSLEKRSGKPVLNMTKKPKKSKVPKESVQS